MRILGHEFVIARVAGGASLQQPPVFFSRLCARTLVGADMLARSRFAFEVPAKCGETRLRLGKPQGKLQANALLKRGS
jgi:hypothetical protein